MCVRGGVLIYRAFVVRLIVCLIFFRFFGCAGLLFTLSDIRYLQRQAHILFKFAHDEWENPRLISMPHVHAKFFTT